MLKKDWRTDPVVQSGLAWMDEYFSVSTNPQKYPQFHYYYLYALERVGMLTAGAMIGRHDWYREGANFLLDLLRHPLPQARDAVARRGLGRQVRQQVIRAWRLLLLATLSSCATTAPAAPRLLFEDDFADLRHWSIEGTGSGAAVDGTLLWDCSGTREGSAWCRTRFEGPTRVSYEVQVLEGRNNINFFGYAPVDLSAQRSGAYGEYHTFPNYLITTLLDGAQWRIRFRRNPGFALLSEARVDGPEPGRWRRVEYEFTKDGVLRLSIDGRTVHEGRDPSPLALSGLHGLRTWRTKLRYRNFRVYALPG
jgi:hypothetical protein